MLFFIDYEIVGFSKITISELFEVETRWRNMLKLKKYMLVTYHLYVMLYIHGLIPLKLSILIVLIRHERTYPASNEDEKSVCKRNTSFHNKTLP